MPRTLLEDRLCAVIAARRDALLEDLRLHVSLPTGGNNAAALDDTRQRLTARLVAIGAMVEMSSGDPRPSWLYGGGQCEPPSSVVCRAPHGGTPILIACHLDTVHDPRGPFRELTISADGSRAVGPGCVDMKGGIVITMAALEALAEIGVRAAWTVILTSDEETGSFCSDAVLVREARRAAAVGGVGLVVEPALPDGALAIERLGSGQFMIEAHGRSAHVGRDFASGVSAVTALAERLIAVPRLCDLQRGVIANVGPIEGNTATNAVPDRARAWGNVRFADEDGALELGARLDELATADDVLPRVLVHRAFNRPAKPITPRTERLALLARAAAEHLGQSLPFASTGGVCDGNILQHAGLPTIDTLGVRGGGLHTPEEWIDLSSLVERCQLLAVLIARISQGAWTSE